MQKRKALFSLPPSFSLGVTPLTLAKKQPLYLFRSSNSVLYSSSGISTAELSLTAASIVEENQKVAI